MLGRISGNFSIGNPQSCELGLTTKNNRMTRTFGACGVFVPAYRQVHFHTFAGAARLANKALGKMVRIAKVMTVNVNDQQVFSPQYSHGALLSHTSSVQQNVSIPALLFLPDSELAMRGGTNGSTPLDICGKGRPRINSRSNVGNYNALYV